MPRFLQFFIFIFVFFPFYLKAEEIDCEKSLKNMESYAIDVITLFGKKTNLSNFVIGSYNMGNTGLCDHRILVKYDRSIPGGSYSQSEIVFRFFNVNSLGSPLKPPVSLIARKPILIKNPSMEVSGNKWMPRPYECDQKEELEEVLARYTDGGYNSPSTLVASSVFPKWEYPYCEYHIFLMKFSNGQDNENSEIWFKHFNLNEGWQVNDHPPIEFKGRRISDSELPLPH